MKVGRILREVGGLRQIGKQVGRAVKSVWPGTGRSAAKRAESSANEYAAQAAEQTAKLDAETKKKRVSAQRLQMRSLRSRRSASYYQSAPTGSETIG